MHPTKESLLAICREYINERKANAQQALAAATDAAADDTKSSAGDKFETTREMMQQEINRHQQLLLDARRMEQVLNSLDAQPHSGTAKPGSLVKTNSGTFFLAISLGKIALGNDTYWIVSAASPIGRMMLGLQAGQHFTLNHTEYRITNVT